MSREWRPVPNLDGYEVSADGLVRSLRRVTPRVLTPYANKDGYLEFFWYAGDRRGRRTVHGSVAGAFIGPRPEGMQVRHLDGNNRNNCVENLTYGTPSENIYDQVRHGTHPKASRTHCLRGHVLDEANTYRNAGHRECRICKRERKRAFDEQRRAEAARAAA